MAQEIGKRLPEDELADLPESIRFMMRMDDFQSLGKALSDLLDLPQSLCKQQGECCKVVIFKGALNHNELLALAESENELEAQNAADFLHLFQPIKEQDNVRLENKNFVAQIESMQPGNKEITYYRCQYLGDDNRCQIHEDRPTGCRMYPIVHERSVFHPGCGYEETAKRNLKLIRAIESFFQRRISELNAQAAALGGQP